MQAWLFMNLPAHLCLSRSEIHCGLSSDEFTASALRRKVLMVPVLSEPAAEGFANDLLLPLNIKEALARIKRFVEKVKNK